MSDAAMTPGNMIEGGAWCELYGDFTDWIDEAGLTVEGLPTWSPDRPVRVLAMPPNRLLLEKVTRRCYRDFRRMVEQDIMVVRPVRRDKLAQMHEVTVLAFDPDKLKAWQAKHRPAEGVTA